MRGHLFKWLAMACWILLSRFAARADAFDEAARLYEKDQAKDAVAAYQQLLKSNGPSFELLYNLGNAQFRAGLPGEALFAWREAEKIRPRDADLRANIAMVMRKAGQPEPTGVARFAGKIRVAEAAWALFTVNFIWACLLAIGARRPDLHQRLAASRWLRGALSVCLWICYGGVQWFRYHAPDAIVVKPSATVRYGPIEESPKAFDVSEASELHTVGARNGWYEIVDPAARRGWISGDQVRVRQR